ncbi:hypothetical protein RCO48_08650 [Peribacillus frigoritolerans]|nr:hypothetical protein [Peribacillus frigoritolerans]
MANERVIDIFEGLLKTKELIAEKEFYAEYREFCLWFDRLGQSERNSIVCRCILRKHTYCAACTATLLYRRWTSTNGALYYALNEKSEVFLFTGKIKSLDGTPLGNTHIRMWHADEEDFIHILQIVFLNTMELYG